MNSSEIGVGFIGTGRISDLHAIEYLQNPKSRIVALCDRELSLVLGRKLDNYMIFNGIHIFSRNEDFGETHQKSHFLLILAI